MTPSTFAAILKAATTPAKIKTVVQPRATSAELFFLDTMTESDTLRIQLSRAWWQSGKPGPYPRNPVGHDPPQAQHHLSTS